MRTPFWITLLFSGFIVLISCTSKPSQPTPTVPLTSPPDRLPTVINSQLSPFPTAFPTTVTPKSSSTFTLTPTPLPTSTPSPEPTKPVLIVYDQSSGGDRGLSIYDYFLLGGGIPDVIIYTDGQMLARSNGWYVEIMLPEQETCNLYAQLEQSLTYTGPTFYSTPAESSFGIGEPSTYLAISKTPVLSISFSIYVLPYLTQEAAKPFKLIQSFQADHSYHPYQPDRLALWIEKVTRSESDLDHSLLDTAWPEAPYHFPSLVDLLNGKDEGIVLAQGDLAAQLVSYLGEKPIQQVFQEAGQDYVLITRPLLPHETFAEVSNLKASPLYPNPFDELSIECLQ